MADKRIADFPTLSQAQDTDLILVSSENETYNVTFATLKNDTQGAPGTGIESYTEYYAVNNSTTAPADSAFSTSVVSPTASNRYLWGYTKIVYTDDTELITAKHMLCVYGTQGLSINTITSYFLRYAQKTGVTRSTSGWSTTVPELTSTYPYMWNYQRFTMSDSTYKYTTPCVVGSIGTKGDKGDTGNTGKTAYQIAVEQGYTGTEAQFGSDLANSANNAAICTQKASDASSYASTASTKASEAATSASNASSAATSAVNTALQNYYNKTQTDNLLSNKLNTADLLNLIYPVGSIYMSTNNVSPQTFIGGTWVTYAEGRVLVGVDPNDTDFDTVGNTGGEKAHTLTVNEIPSHQHGVPNYHTSGSAMSFTTNTATPNSNDGWPTNIRTQFTGGGLEHNNLQPYITCYMWQRTA